ncbi:MAG: hypothetical protein WCJ85_08565 [Chitinophagaceae bacterium]
MNRFIQTNTFKTTIYKINLIIPNTAVALLKRMAFACMLFFSSTAFAQTVLQFNGTNQYVTSGVTPSNSILNSSTFTVETWFRRDGTGAGVTTGGGGIASAVPLDRRSTNFWVDDLNNILNY